MSNTKPCPEKCELCNARIESWEDLAWHIFGWHAGNGAFCPCGVKVFREGADWENEIAHLQSQPDLWRHLRSEDRQPVAVAGGTAVVDSDGRVELWTQSGTLPGSEPVVLVSQPGHGPTIVAADDELPTIDEFRRRVADMTTLLQQHADKLSGMYVLARAERNAARMERRCKAEDKLEALKRGVKATVRNLRETRAELDRAKEMLADVRAEIIQSDVEIVRLTAELAIARRPLWRRLWRRLWAWATGGQ